MAMLSGRYTASGSSIAPTSSQTNTVWTRTDGTVKVAPFDATQPAYMTVSDSSQVSTQIVIPSDGYTWTAATAGIGGRRTGSEANDTGYAIYLVTKADGATPALLSEISGTDLTHAALATLDSEYLNLSQMAMFASNDGSSNIRPFIDGGNGVFTYDVVQNDTRILTTGTATTPNSVAVDFTGFVPTNCIAITNTLAFNTNASGAATFYTDSAEANRWSIHMVVDDVAGAVQQQSQFIEVAIVDPATSLYYEWSATPSSGAQVKVRGFRMRR